MSILSDFEDRVGRAIEGVFAGVFRAPVQPAELARAAAKEMDRRKKLGVGKVYAPTMYSVLLSPEDGTQLAGFTDTLAGELETYLMGYANERDYELPCRPRVRFLVDEELRLGRFEVIGELLSPDEIAAELGEAGLKAPEAAPAAPAPAAPVAAVAAPAAPLEDVFSDVFADDEADAYATEQVPEPAPASLATVTVPGIAHDIALSGPRMTLGRLKTCDIVLQDANASREHLAFEREGSGWAVVDLGSTNGTVLNGSPVRREHLADGDVITVGVTELVYHQSGS